MPNRRRTWPYNGAAESPAAITASPDGNWNSGRSFAGPLRIGTAPGVGPRGAPAANALDSDLGVDRISPRRFDPIGTQDERAPPFPSSELIARDARRRRR